MNQKDKTDEIRCALKDPIDLAFTEDFTIINHVCGRCKAIIQSPGEHQENPELCVIQSVIGS